MNTLADYIAQGITFRPFDDADWELWAGCDSENPMIGENEDGSVVVIIEENRVAVYEIIDGKIINTLDGAIELGDLYE